MENEKADERGMPGLHHAGCSPKHQARLPADLMGGS